MTPPCRPGQDAPGRLEEAQRGDAAAPAHKGLDSTTLLRGGRSVEIRHNGEVYRLHATRLGKLILTK